MINKKRQKQVCNVFIILLLLLFGCKSSNTHLSTKFFNTDCNGIKCSLDTVNAYSGYVILNSQDTIFYNLGFTVSPLSDNNVPEIVYVPPGFSNAKNGDTSVRNNLKDPNVIVERRRDYDIDRYRKQNIFFKEFRGHLVKYTFPVDTNKGGIVGVYYDSIKVTKYGVLKFNAFSTNLHPGNYAKCRDVINQIYLYPFDSTNLSLPTGTIYIQ